MFDEPTPNLALPYILPAQAQKHVTHNEAVRALDALVHLTVVDRDLATPPTSPAEGRRWLVASAPTGAWAGKAGQIAAWQDGAWAFFEPREGFLAWLADEDIALGFDGSAWHPLGGPTTLAGQALQNLDRVGINATADATNRLSVAAAATLFNHAGAGHQLKLNKSAAAETGSVLFQSGFSGRAEIGTIGDDRLRVKVSADGTTFRDALTIDGASGHIGVGAAPSASVRLDLVNDSVRAGSLQLDEPAGTAIDLVWQRAGSWRWALSTSNTAESSTATGSDLVVTRYNNAGALAGTPLRITRSSGEITLTATVRTYLCRPHADNTYDLGTSSGRWVQLWAVNATIQTSDARDKTDIAALSDVTAARLVDGLAPVSFRWRSTTSPAPASELAPEADAAPVVEPIRRPGRRRHAGFLAQDMKAAFDALDLDLAAWGLSDHADPQSRQWLRPDELLPLLWAAVRATRSELAALQAQVTGQPTKPATDLP
jgi:hypothetical protein